MPGFKRIRIKKVSRVALLQDGANLTRGLYKAAGATELTITPLAKSETTEEGLMHSIVYAPDFPDAHGHFMGKADIKKAAYTHAQSGMTLDLYHGDVALKKEQVYIAEHMLLSGPDDRFPKADRTGRTIPHEGAWATITHFVDPDLRKRAREGELGEVSLYAAAGDFELEDVAESDLPSALRKSSEEDNDMKPEELQAALAASNKTLLEGITAALNPLVKALVPATPTVPPAELKDEFDPTNPVHLAKMQFNADMNDLYDAYGIDPAKPKEGVALLKGEDLKMYTEDVTKLKEHHGLSKGVRRAGGVGGSRFNDRDNSPKDGSFEDWNTSFGHLPLTKARLAKQAK